MTLFNNSSLPAHPGTIFESITTYARGAADTEQHALFTFRSKLKVIIFVFFAHKKYFRSFEKLRLNPWCHMDYFNISLLCFWALIVVVHLVSMKGQKALRFLQKYLNVCSEDERRSYRFGTTWGWVINDNCHFWVNYPFKSVVRTSGVKERSLWHV